MSATLDDLDQLSTSGKQTLLQNLIRSLLESEGAESVRQTIISTFERQPDQPPVTPPIWVAALLDMDLPLPAGYVSSEEFLASVMKGLEAEFADK